jgi:hypothetical protein
MFADVFRFFVFNRINIKIKAVADGCRQQIVFESS